jgi:hypothetical protein
MIRTATGCRPDDDHGDGRWMLLERITIAGAYTLAQVAGKPSLRVGLVS